MVATDLAAGVALASTYSQAPASDTLTAQMVEPQLTPGKCKVYRTYYRTIVGPAAPLRWGDSKFGYRHIRNKHGFQSRRIDWVLHNGRVIQHSGKTYVLQGQYPGDRNPFRVVYADNFHSDRCPGLLLGIITAYHRTR